MRDWIKNLKIGDLVFVNHRVYSSLQKVEAITPAGNIKVNGILFNQNGSERGGDRWDRFYLSEATPEKLKTFRETMTVKKAFRLMKETKKITLEQANKIIELLDCTGEMVGDAE